MTLKLCLYLIPFLTYSASKNGMTLKPGLGLFKVIENGTILLIYRFLLVGHCKYSSMWYRFRVI